MLAHIDWRKWLRTVGLAIAVIAGYFAVIILLSITIAVVLGFHSGLPQIGGLVHGAKPWAALVLFLPPLVLTMAFAQHSTSLKGVLNETVELLFFLPCVNTALLFMLAEADMGVVLIPIGLMLVAITVEMFRAPWRDSVSATASGTAFACFAYWADHNLPSWWLFAVVPVLFAAVWLFFRWRRPSVPAADHPPIVNPTP